MKYFLLILVLCLFVSAPTIVHAYSGSAFVDANSRLKYGDVVSLWATFDCDGDGSGLTTPSIEINCSASWYGPCGNLVYSDGEPETFTSSLSFDDYEKRTFDCGDSGTYGITASAEVIVYENYGSKSIVVDEGNTDYASEVVE